MTFRRLAVSAALACLVLSFGAGSTHAFNIDPVIYEMAPSGPRATQVVRLTNTQPGPISIEVTAVERTYTLEGVEQRRPASGDFVIFPPLSTIQVGATQAFRVQYVGRQPLETSRSYLVMFTQLPVQREAAASGLDVVFEIGTAAHVIPPGAAPKTSVTSATPTADGRSIRLQMRNDGNAYARMATGQLTIRNGDGATATLADQALAGVVGQGLVLPRSERIFTIPAPSDFALKPPLTVTFQPAPSVR